MCTQNVTYYVLRVQIRICNGIVNINATLISSERETLATDLTATVLPMAHYFIVSDGH